MAGFLSEKFAEVDKKNGWMLLFTALRQQSAQNFPAFDDAKLPTNARLNRYRDVLPFDHSRVRLGNDGYINASHVPIPEADRSYILTQGPLSNTSGDFWQMVWEQKTHAVVMLNRIMEKGQNKCHLYYPSSDDTNGFASKSQKYGNFDLELLDERKSKHYVIRSIQLTNTETGERREVTHFQFVTWPDFGVPESTSDFLEFLLEVRKSGLLNYRKYGLPIIHCSAGVGRSGTFVIADAALVIAHKTKDPSQVDIVQMVLELRQYRMGLIQTHEQLRFSWKAVVDALDQKRWKELVDITCTDDQDSTAADPDAHDLSDEIGKVSRPMLKRLSGNQLTDDSSDTETEDVDEEDENAESTMAHAACTKELEKSPKRPRPDISHPAAEAIIEQAKPPSASEADAKNDDEDEKKKEEGSNSGESSQTTNVVEGGASTSGGGSNAESNANDTTSTATERYEARLRRRQHRALEMQKKIDKIHENLRRTSSADVWNRYSNLLYGGAAVLVGGLLIYLFCRWGF